MGKYYLPSAANKIFSGLRSLGKIKSMGNVLKR